MDVNGSKSKLWALLGGVAVVAWLLGQVGPEIIGSLRGGVDRESRVQRLERLHRADSPDGMLHPGAASAQWKDAHLAEHAASSISLAAELTEIRLTLRAICRATPKANCP